MSETLIERLKQVAENDWRVAFLAHTSDTAKEAAASLTAKDSTIAALTATEAELRQAIIQLRDSRDDNLALASRWKARVAVLEKALEPFAKQADTHAAQIPDEMWIDDYVQPEGPTWHSTAGIRVGELRAARAALGAGQPTEAENGK